MVVSVLIIARRDDVHANAVAREITALGGDFAIADLSEFPRSSMMNIRYSCCGDRNFEIELAGKRRDLEAFGSVWWRRPQQPVVSDEVQGATNRLFALNEASEALTGLWNALDAFWVNDPARDHVAHRKVMQLRKAQDAGFRIPDTLISNDPDRVRMFVDGHGYRNVVYKSFSALEEAWRETRVLRPDELEMLNLVRHAPVIFQEYVEAVYDVRITVVGREAFAAAIHSQQTEYPQDFRMDMASARITPLELPSDVDSKVVDYVRSLGLQYGAIDMRLRPDGEYVFLEINPAGQWLFVEEVTKQPIAGALARLLLEHDGHTADK